MDSVLHNFGYSLEFLCEQIGDVAEENMAAQPKGVVNHPAWTAGHILYTCQMIGGVIGVEKWLPRGWGKLFGTGSVPLSPPPTPLVRKEGSFGVYPTKEEFLALIRETRSRITQAVEGLDEAFLDSPFPEPSYLEFFPTIRHSLTQVLVGHVSFHVGQLSVWRRAMGLPPMRNSFQ